MRSKHKLSNFIVEDHFYPNCELGAACSRRPAMLSRRKKILEDETDVIREYSGHMCCSHSIPCNSPEMEDLNQEAESLSHFTRNFKILFIKGDDLLFRN